MRVALYARSTVGDEEGQRQLLALRKAAHEMDHMVTSVYRQKPRPFEDVALRELIEDAESGLFDALLCVSLSRLGREGLAVKQLQAAGIEIVRTS